MNDKQIYELVARKPRIRASELAAALNVELTVISGALRSLVDVGDLVKTMEFYDNGRQSQVYELSDEFKKSREYKELMAPDVKPVGPTVAPEPEPVPVLQAAEPTGTKVDRAIACIRQHGQATVDQLRAAMGLAAHAAPTSYLASAMKDGRVVRDGDVWKLGPGRAAAPKALDSVERVGNIIVATKDATPIPQAVVDAIAATPAMTPPAASQQHRCAIWSDGTYELQTDGERVAVLTQEQAVAFVSFIERMGAA